MQAGKTPCAAEHPRARDCVNEKPEVLANV
jgi:hypothetical protein